MLVAQPWSYPINVNTMVYEQIIVCISNVFCFVLLKIAVNVNSLGWWELEIYQSC